MRALLLGIVFVAFAGCSTDEPYEPPPTPGDPNSTGGDPASGDPVSGDPVSGDPVSGDSVSGDPVSGDPLNGDPVSGDPISGDPLNGDPVSGDPYTCDCTIAATCYADGDTHPTNPCLVCDPDNDTTDWTDNDGADCNNGSYCDGADTCSGGTCSQSTGVDPCAAAGDVCYEEMGGRCCTPDVGRMCSNGDAHSADSCGHPGDLLDDCLDVGGVCVDGLCGCAPGTTGPTCSDCVVYVDGVNGLDSRSGVSWAAAKQTIQAGINLADAQNCQVWVATDTYPEVIAMADGVGVYGGFVGDEIRPDLRDWDVHPTIIDGNDSGSVVVVDGSSVSADDATLDGFIITGGGGVNNGAGIRCAYASNFTVDNCTVTGNTADRGGAGLSLLDCTASIDNSHFESNSAEAGAAMSVYGTTVSVTNSTFTGNIADEPGNNGNNDGGAIAVSSGIVSLDTCTFSDNLALRDGGAIANASSTIVANDCTFTNNSGTMGGAAYVHNGASLTGTGLTFERNTAEYGGAIAADGSVDPIELRLTDSTFSWNEAIYTGVGTGRGGAIYNTYGSPMITGCRFDHNVANSGGAICHWEGGGQSVIADTAFVANRAVSNGGGVYATYHGLVFTNCVFSANVSESSGGGVGAGDFGAPRIQNCVFEGNYAEQRGGGISSAAAHSSWLVAGSTFSHNRAGLTGGGLSTSDDILIDNSIFWGNTAPSDNQIYLHNSPTASIRWSAVEGGCAATGATTCSNEVTGDPLLENVPTATYLTTGDGAMSFLTIAGASSIISNGDRLVVESDGVLREVTNVSGDVVTLSSLQPLPSASVEGQRVDLWPSSANDGVVDLSLSPTSPAIDAAAHISALWTDIEGKTRVDIAPTDTDPWGYADVGAYEYNGTPCGTTAYFPGTGHYYWGSCSTFSHSNARNVCELDAGGGGNLVAITSQEENDFVATQIRGTSWTGARYLSGSWGWYGGETWGYTNWGDGEPGSDDWGFMSTDGTWGAASSSGFATYLRVMCER